jgi:hypothetical protein
MRDRGSVEHVASLAAKQLGDQPIVANHVERHRDADSIIVRSKGPQFPAIPRRKLIYGCG